MIRLYKKRESIVKPLKTPKTLTKEYKPQTIDSPTHIKDVDLVYSEMIKEKKETKENVYALRSEGLKVIKYSPKVTIVNCALTDDQVRLLFECADIIKDGHNVKITRSFK